MSITALRLAVTNAAGTPTQYTHVGLLRELITAWGGTPTQYSILGLLRQAITKVGGTPTQNTQTSLLRQLVTALGGTPISFNNDDLWAQIASLAAVGTGGGTMTPPSLTKTTAAGVNPPQWDSSITGYISWDAATSSGDKQAMRWRRVNGGTWTTEADQPLDDELLTGGFTWPLYEAAKPLAAGYFEAQEQRARFVAGVETARSSWSPAGQVVDTLIAVPFTPAQVTGIKDYYKVSMARCWKDTGGTIPVTADGDAVARWDSEMGIMAPFTQATLANRPLYRTNSGNPYLDFDGTNDNMTCGTTGITSVPQPFYEIAAVKLNALLGSQAVFDGTQVGQRANLFQNNIGAPDYEWELGAGTFVGNQGMVPTTNNVVIGGLFNGASSKGRIDQTDGTTVSIGAGTFAGGGGAITLGSAYNAASFLGGRIYGFVLVAASPSAGDKTSLSTYLGALQGRTI